MQRWGLLVPAGSSPVLPLTATAGFGCLRHCCAGYALCLVRTGRPSCVIDCCPTNTSVRHISVHYHPER